tara:strand:- start:989 stop:1279 length:291 start_codon:yes stop_codon:yes gene_type:complete
MKKLRKKRMKKRKAEAKAEAEAEAKAEAEAEAKAEAETEYKCMKCKVGIKFDESGIYGLSWPPQENELCSGCRCSRMCSPTELECSRKGCYKVIHE